MYRVMPDGELKDYYRWVLDEATRVGGRKVGRIKKIGVRILQRDAAGADPKKRLFATELLGRLGWDTLGADWKQRQAELEGRLPVKMPSGGRMTVVAVAGAHELRVQTGRRGGWINLPIVTFLWPQVHEYGARWLENAANCGPHIALYRRACELQDAVPDSTGIQDALDRLGKRFDEWFAA